MDVLTRIEPKNELDQEEIRRIKELTGYQAFGDLDEEFLLRLIDIGVTPFDPKTVENYKEKMLAELTPRPPHENSELEWSFRPLAGYGQPVPMSVLGLAATIKSKLPDCGLWVDVLGRKKYWELLDDPFLVVSEAEPQYTQHFGWLMEQGKFYHVAVWDEPTFNDIALDN